MNLFKFVQILSLYFQQKSQQVEQRLINKFPNKIIQFEEQKSNKNLKQKNMQHPILTKSSSQLNKWTAYKSWRYPRDLLKSIPQMSQQQLDLNMVQINLCAYYNPDVLQMINNKMVDKGFYMKNRHVLQNLVNTYNRQKGLNEKINQISKKFDDIYINGIQLGNHQAKDMQLLNEQEKHEEKQCIKNESFSQSQYTTATQQLSQPQSSNSKQQQNSNKTPTQKQKRSTFITERQKFILFLSNISDKLFQAKQGKTQDQIHSNKHNIFVQSLVQLNRSIQEHQSTSSQQTNQYMFYFKQQFHHIKSINIENSTFIHTKNRNPLKLDFGFTQFIYKNDDQLAHQIIAMQFIKYLNKIFDKELIKEYQILPQIKGALYEFVQHAKTIAQIKKQHQDLLSYLKFLAEKQNVQLKVLQKRFAQTYAGYCIAEFMLDIKDRNNANIMLKDDGTFFHIDLAFIFNAKPGGISFQSAPFKMTKQYIKAMGGFESDNFKYFQSLLIQLITKIYESKDEYLCKLDILGSRSKEIRCFNGFDIQKYRNLKIVKSLDDTRSFVQNLIDKSYDSWCTKKYDTYQWKTNKIPA